MHPKNNYRISLMNIPLQYQKLESQILPEIRKVLLSGQYIMGPQVKKFEEEFAKYCDAKHCIGTSSGTEALFIALLSLGIKAGDEVITVPNTFTATAESIILTGARPVFCDVDQKTFSLDPKSLISKITSRTKAIIPVHLHGNPAPMEEIFKIAESKKISVVEDAAQAQGATYEGKKIGSLKSQFTCFSFHPVKNLGAFGDAGALTTQDSRLAKKARLLINHGRVNHHKHQIIGTTARLDTIQAAALSVKLKYLNGWIAQRREIAHFYRKNLPPQITQISQTEKAKSSYHIFAILAPKRNRLIEFLANKGIETGIHYPIPLHLQPAYKSLNYQKGDFPISEFYTQRTLSIPLYPYMAKEEAGFIVEKIKEFYGQK